MSYRETEHLRVLIANEQRTIPEPSRAQVGLIGETP
jgi:hypothetical protein